MHLVVCLSELGAGGQWQENEMATGQKSSLATESNTPVADSLITFQSISKYATEGEIMVFKKGDLPWNKHMKGFKHSEETKNRMSEAHKGKESYWKGKKRPEETKRKVSASKKDRPNSGWFKKGHKSWLGKLLSEMHKTTLSAAHKGQHAWNKDKHGCYSPTTLKKMSETHKGKTPWLGKKHTETSRDKMSERQSGERSHRWQGGISFEPYCYKFNNKLKERIRKRDNRTCQLCGKKENGRKLDVHHIHYDKPNCHPDLIALCTGCNGRVNLNRDYYESLFMEKLKERGLIDETIGGKYGHQN